MKDRKKKQLRSSCSSSLLLDNIQEQEPCIHRQSESLLQDTLPGLEGGLPKRASQTDGAKAQVKRLKDSERNYLQFEDKHEFGLIHAACAPCALVVCFGESTSQATEIYIYLRFTKILICVYL